MWAGTVAAPACSTEAGARSTISMSRSVAFSDSSSPSARSSTLARIGMVFRRSTTRWTWLSAFRRFARSIRTFMIFNPWRRFPDSDAPRQIGFGRRNLARPFGKDKSRKAPHRSSKPKRERVLPAPATPIRHPQEEGRAGRLFLNQPLQKLDLLRQNLIGGRQFLDLSDSMQHRCVVAA